MPLLPDRVSIPAKSAVVKREGLFSAFLPPGPGAPPARERGKQPRPVMVPVIRIKHFRPGVSGKTAFFPRNDRPYGLKRTAFQTENTLAAAEWRPQAVPVATKEATGIDSRDEGFPFPPNKLRIALTGLKKKRRRKIRRRIKSGRLSAEAVTSSTYARPAVRRAAPCCGSRYGRCRTGA